MFHFFRLWHPVFATIMLIDHTAGQRFNISPLEVVAAYNMTGPCLGGIMLFFAWLQLRQSF
jgi:hypothetical protein